MGKRYSWILLLGVVACAHHSDGGGDAGVYTSLRVLPDPVGLAVPIGGGDLTASSTVSYRSLTHQFETASPFLDQPGYTLLGADLNYSFGDGRYSIGLHGKNLTDVRYKTAGYQYIKTDLAGTPINAANAPITNGTGYVATLGKEGVATAFYGNPRQVFVSFGLKF